MSDIADIALEFAKVCMGWDDAKQEPFLDGHWPFIIAPGRKSFAFTDLNAVMNEARKWCDKHEANLDVYYVPVPTALWHVSAGADSIKHGDLCHALMAACLAASRKLKLAP